MTASGECAQITARASPVFTELPKFQMTGATG
ncbi:hypothetical protein CcI6DRAFT_03808 [Frankia sp. CcI6]|nr:hypothetical protein CcI6DRAFT_03808 [Frankia sp. CcI6]OAA21313.1 hypothetical protein AAY23_107916 [Frankia casuarinae]